MRLTDPDPLICASKEKISSHRLPKELILVCLDKNNVLSLQ